MSKPAASLVIKGLKCDAAGCDFMDEAAIPDEALIGKPCPKCGANLLTAVDMAHIRLLQGFVGIVNFEEGSVPEDTKMCLTPLIMDGTGRLDFGETKPE